MSEKCATHYFSEAQFVTLSLCSMAQYFGAFFPKIKTKWGKALEQCVGALKPGGSNFLTA